MFVKSTTDDVMASIATETTDKDGVSTGDWIERLVNADDFVYDLVVEIARNRHNPAFKDLVFNMEAVIDAALWDREHEVSGAGAA